MRFQWLIVLCIASVAAAAARSPATRSKATTSPAPPPDVVELLRGQFRGTVMDDDEVVPIATEYRRVSKDELIGRYQIREGPRSYPGTLDGFSRVKGEPLLCRFTWHDFNGVGVMTIKVSPDGETFAGYWGEEAIQEKLIWNGKRVHEGPSTRAGRVREKP